MTSVLAPPVNSTPPSTTAADARSALKPMRTVKGVPSWVAGIVSKRAVKAARVVADAVAALLEPLSLTTRSSKS